MKKWLSLLLALAMALPLAACGSAGNQENTPEPPASVSGSTAEETPASTDAETAAEEPAEGPAESETPAAEDSGSVLIAYFSGTALPGWTSLMLSLWFIGSLLLIALGIIGEYIGKIYIEVKHRPRFLIEKCEVKENSDSTK